MSLRLFPMLRQKRKTKLAVFAFLVLFLFCFLPNLALAQDINQNLNTLSQTSGLPTTNLITFIGNIVRIILGLLGLVLVLLIMYAGFIWMTASGDPAKVNKAKKIIYNAIIGLIIIVASFAIVSFVMSIFGGALGGVPGQPGGPTIGGDDDWSRSALGAGPIESVYPRPYQSNVYINTWVAVTFKMTINTSTMMEWDSALSGYKMKNVEICEISSTSSDPGCLSVAQSEFNRDAYSASTTLATNDGRTFVFFPTPMLGKEDNQVRRFKVFLKRGIKSMADEDILARYGDGYKWAFSTNGKLDLDPPVVERAGLMPTIDQEPDLYSAGTPPSGALFEFSRKINGTPALATSGVNLLINKRQDIFVSEAFASVTTPSTPLASTTGAYTGIVSGWATTTIDSGTGKAVTVWFRGTANEQTFIDPSYSIGDASINTGPYGIGLNLKGTAARGNQWSFRVQPYQEGDRVEITRNGLVFKTYTFTQTTSTISLMITDIVTNNPTIFTAAGSYSLRTVETGREGNKYNVNFFIKNTPTFDENSVYVKKTDGSTSEDQITVKDKRDLPRNYIFQVRFSEPINPLVASTSFFVRLSLQSFATSGFGTFVTSTIALASDYRTVEIAPPHEDEYKCGQNSCGEDMYCWPVNGWLDADRDNQIDPGAVNDYAHKATRYKINIAAAPLKKCEAANSGWCTSWGGSCETVTKKCFKLVGGDRLYYPLSGVISGYDVGIMDMAGNSFNGNYSTTTYNDTIIGSSDGRSMDYEKMIMLGTPDEDFYPTSTDPLGRNRSGGSNRYPYDFNTMSRNTSTSDVPPRSVSYPIYEATSTAGDDARYKFWLSDKIDREAPLIKQIFPTAENPVFDFSTPVSTTFDRLLRATTLKPGWNYGFTKQEKSKRYLVLSTLITKNQIYNPVGYWIDVINQDLNLDGVAEATQALIGHNLFSANIKYGPLIGSGIQSITQNCFVPSVGPKDAAATPVCNYLNGVPDANCSSNLLPNPAAFASSTCEEIALDYTKEQTAIKCATSTSECLVFYYKESDWTNNNATSTKRGSAWVLTQDFPSPDPSGKTGCCFGVCVDSATGKIRK